MGNNMTLDPRAYEFEELASLAAPVWQVMPCKKHDRWYHDLVGVQLPLSVVHQEEIRCGCMKAWNVAAREYLESSTAT